MEIDKAKLAKTAVKIGIGMVGSLTIGYVIKGEKALGAKIDEIFVKPATDN